METQSAQATIAARMDRLPIFSMHRRLMAVLGVGTFFDLYDIFLGGVLAAILTDTLHLARPARRSSSGPGSSGCSSGRAYWGSSPTTSGGGRCTRWTS